MQEHGHQVAAQDDPQQFIAELCAALDIGGEVSGVHVGNAGDEGRAEEGQQAGEPAFLAFAGEHGFGVVRGHVGIGKSGAGWFLGMT